MANCPSCNTPIDESEVGLGEILVCTGCGADLEVISLNPVTFEVYEQEEK
ncbi:MAG TPA: lysine biosynthesis protein LysW [Candidatus Dormibacteraeota bacterium]|jgi:lysine biosynthesis protein LysW|nr:lysine biosynthesis protein LysW [Candidatus Dormibacteraeota bacterium]